MIVLGKQLLLWGSIFLTGCSMQSFPGQDAAPPLPSCVIADQNLSAKENEAIAELRRNVEAGPLYSLSTKRAGIATCSAKYETGVLTLEYNFRDKGWLRVKRDSRIEYNDQEVRFGSPLEEEPKAILKRAELAAFGKDGCGIDWEQFEKQPTPDDPQGVETIFRGDTCNCQARIRTDAAGRTIGLKFRSTC